VEGTAQIYQGAMQMIATQISRALPSEIDAEDFMPLVAIDLDRLAQRLKELLRGMQDPHLRNLAECFLLDEHFMARFTRAPAGVKNHHAYVGGLLDHVVSLMEVCTRVAPCYPGLNADLLLMGAFVHDVGKIEELSYDRAFAYTDEGQLIGHLVMAVSMLEAKVREAEKLSGETIPAETVLRLKHIIVSHHGEYEFGSPKLPMTLEAVALHHLDNLDAKLHSFQQQIRDDPNVESPWTHYNPTINRKLYKGRGA
jgi:3'-5' exoribonuclease